MTSRRSIMKTTSIANSTRNSQNNQNPKKSVRFNPAARFILIRPSDKQTTALIRYTEDDYKRIRKSVKKTVRAVRTYHEQFPDGNFDEDMCHEAEPKYCARGLEHLRTAEYLEQQMINKDCAIESVLAAQDRLDDEEVAEDAAANNEADNYNNEVDNSQKKHAKDLDQRIRSIYDQTSDTKAAMAKLRAQQHRLDQRARHIAASYRVHNRWALHNALELAAQDELYVEEHVRPTLEQEPRELGLLERRAAKKSASYGSSAISPLHTLACLQESLALDGDGDGDGENSSTSLDATSSEPTAPSSLLSAAAIANMAASASASSSLATIVSTSTSSTSTAQPAPSSSTRARPHAPSRIQPPANWLQHRDSLQLGVGSSLDHHGRSRSSPKTVAPPRRASGANHNDAAPASMR